MSTHLALMSNKLRNEISLASVSKLLIAHLKRLLQVNRSTKRVMPTSEFVAPQSPHSLTRFTQQAPPYMDLPSLVFEGHGIAEPQQALDAFDLFNPDHLLTTDKYHTLTSLDASPKYTASHVFASNYLSTDALTDNTTQYHSTHTLTNTLLIPMGHIANTPLYLHFTLLTQLPNPSHHH